jgi:hypothetical protein
MTMARRALPAGASTLLVAMFVSRPLLHLLTEAWWFEGVGFTGVFWTRLGWQVLLFTLPFLICATFLRGNLRWAIRRTRAAGWIVQQGFI